MRSIWERYYTSANTVVFVADSSDQERMDEAKKEFEGVCRHDVLKRIPMVILANKQDLALALSPIEVSAALQGTQDIAKVFGISVLSGIGVDAALTHIINEAKIHAADL